MNKIALDTNILIYLYDVTDQRKRHISESLLALKPVISSQVISEYLNVSKRLQKLPKLDVMEKCIALLEFCEITSYLTPTTEPSTRSLSSPFAPQTLNRIQQRRFNALKSH